MKKRLLGSVVLLAACSSPLEPLTGEVYVLESIAGVRLPAPFAQNPDVNLRIVADTIAFTSGSHGERRTYLETGAAGEVRRERIAFSYSDDAGQVEIAYPCPPNASCIAPPHLVGTLTSASFTVTTSKISRAPMVFRRLYPPD